jgi:hypothetical protein
LGLDPITVLKVAMDLNILACIEQSLIDMLVNMTGNANRNIFMNNKLFIILTFFIIILISPGCAASVTTSPSNTGNLKVQVLGVDKVPLAGVKVISDAEPAGQLKVTGMTKSDGTVIYNNIATGEYTFYVSVAGYQQVDFKVTVQQGKTTGVTVNLVLTITLTP